MMFCFYRVFDVVFTLQTKGFYNPHGYSSHLLEVVFTLQTKGFYNLLFVSYSLSADFFIEHSILFASSSKCLYISSAKNGPLNLPPFISL